MEVPPPAAPAFPVTVSLALWPALIVIPVMWETGWFSSTGIRRTPSSTVLLVWRLFTATAMPAPTPLPVALLPSFLPAASPTTLNS